MYEVQNIHSIILPTCYPQEATTLKGPPQAMLLYQSNQEPEMDKTVALECITFWCRKLHYILYKISLHVTLRIESVLSHKSLPCH